MFEINDDDNIVFLKIECFSFLYAGLKVFNTELMHIYFLLLFEHKNNVTIIVKLCMALPAAGNSSVKFDNVI